MNSIVLAAALLLAATPQAELDQLRKQLIDAETDLYKQVMHFRPCGEAAVANAESPLRMQRFDVTAKGDFYDADLRLHRTVFMENRELETLHLKAVDGGNVALDAKVVEACWDSKWSGPRAQQQPAGDVIELERRLYRERLEHVKSLAAEAAKITARMQPSRVLEAVDAATNAWSKQSLRLSELQFANGTLTLRGVALGKPARDAIEPALRKAGFENAKIEWTPAGDCRAFVAKATLSAKAPAADDEKIGFDVFDERGVALCNAGPSTAAKPVTAKGSGSFTLHARDIDAGKVFLLLHELNPVDGFLVEPAVDTRIDLRLDNVTVDEVLGALKDYKIASAGAGPFHRVCKLECPAMETQEYKGEAISLMVSDAEVLDIFRVLREVTGLEVFAKSLPGTISIYTTDVEWDRLFDTLSASIGKKYTLEGDGVHLDRDGVPVEKLTAAPGGRGGFFEREPKNIAVEDVRLTAIAGDGESWMAWARVPGAAKQLFKLEPGMALYDGSVVSVSAEKVVLRTKDGKDVPLSFR